MNKMPNISEKFIRDEQERINKIKSEYDFEHLSLNDHLEPVPLVSNQEKQIELLTDIVNKQSEMVNMQSAMVQKQSELIELIHQESVDSKKESKRAMTISLIALAISTLDLLIPYLYDIVKYFF